MNLRDRLLQFIKYKELTTQKFEQLVGLSNAAVAKMGDNTRRSTIDKISNVFPELNQSWLLTGEGQMLKSESANAQLIGAASPAIAEDTTPVRFFEVTPTATFQEFCVGSSESASTINILPAHGEILDESFCVFEVHGESMAPQIQPRARVLCQEVAPTKWHTLHDCVVVIAYADKFVIKRIATNHLQTEDYLVLASDNPDYPQRETVQLADIRAIFRAKRIISSAII